MELDASMKISFWHLLKAGVAGVVLLAGCSRSVPTQNSEEERAAFRGKAMPPEARAKVQQMKPPSTKKPDAARPSPSRP